eukprot:280421-Pleurochrysis_carterae.AAC.1
MGRGVHTHQRRTARRRAAARSSIAQCLPPRPLNLTPRPPSCAPHQPRRSSPLSRVRTGRAVYI